MASSTFRSLCFSDRPPLNDISSSAANWSSSWEEVRESLVGFVNCLATFFLYGFVDVMFSLLPVLSAGVELVVPGVIPAFWILALQALIVHFGTTLL